MVIDVRKLNVQKQYVGRLEFEVEGDNELIDIPFVHFASTIKVTAEYEIFADDSVEVKGQVTFTLEGQCSRCLSEAKEIVVAPLEALFEDRADAEDYAYSGGKIDLSDAVRDAVLVSMPRVLSCGDECQGIQY